MKKDKLYSKQRVKGWLRNESALYYLDKFGFRRWENRDGYRCLDDLKSEVLARMGFGPEVETLA